MSEQRRPKPISEVLRSPRFHREVSSLLFFFAFLTAIFAVFLFAAGSSDEDTLASAVGYVMATIIYSVLAVFIRRGSTIALVITGILLVLNLLATLFGPSWEGAVGMLVGNGLLIFVLIRYIRRERNRVDVQEVEQ